MAFTAGSLASGQLAIAVAAIYTASSRVVVRSLNFYNTNVAGQTINVYIKRSGQARVQLYRSASVAQYARVSFLTGGESLILSNGDSIDADTTTASAVDYYIGGAVDA